MRVAPESAWLLPGLWQVFFSQGVFASCRLLPRPAFAVGVFYLAAGIATLLFARGAFALSPWAMALPFGLGQLLAAAVLYWTLERTDGQAPRPESGRYAYDGLDRVIHEKARLGILTSLLGRPDGLLFNDLKSLCALTDGNLSRHLTILQEAGLVEVWKGLKGKRPQTLVRITDQGRARFREYLERPGKRDPRRRSRPGAQSRDGPFRRGWSPA